MHACSHLYACEQLDALRQFELPIEPRFVYVGSIRFDLPLMRLGTAAVRVTVREVYALCASAPLAESTEAVRRGRDALVTALASILGGLEHDDDDDDIETDWRPGDGLRANALGLAIGRNLAVDIGDFHLRFEDGQGWALGVTVASANLLPAVPRSAAAAAAGEKVAWRKRLLLKVGGRGRREPCKHRTRVRLRLSAHPKGVRAYCSEDCIYMAQVRRGAAGVQRASHH